MFSTVCFSQDVKRERPKEWKGIVEGGRFMDRFLPMKGKVLTSKTWGCNEVKPRFVDNGIEDNTFSYWGGNIIYRDGKYHLFVCGWLENSPKGHMTWSNSMIFHTISDKLEGPYKNIGWVGFGHNPEIYQTNSGEYIVSCSIQWNPYYYVSKSLNGPWKQVGLKMNPRDRKIIDGTSNLSFAKREDGSMIMVCRGGGIWISKDGISEYNQVTNKSIYPAREGRFEDPVIWRDNIQYHLIVNDWLGRIAYYMRSKDGVNWVEDCGEAYIPGIAYHEDGKVEEWYKFERIKVFQDEFGRAIQTNFAVNDTLKNLDLGDDNHSSKNITIPINKGMLLEIENDVLIKGMKTVSVRIKGEDGFNPQKDIDLKSLRFGCSKDVNYGKGCKIISSKSDGVDLIVKFNTKGYLLPDSEFAPKIIGKSNNGKMIYGYARNPNVDFKPAILSCRKPVVENDIVSIVIDNFGLSASKPSILSIYQNKKLISKIDIPSIEPYQSTSVKVNSKSFTKNMELNINGDNVVQLDDKFIIK